MNNHIYCLIILRDGLQVSDYSPKQSVHILYFLPSQRISSQCWHYTFYSRFLLPPPAPTPHFITINLKPRHVFDQKYHCPAINCWSRFHRRLQRYSVWESNESDLMILQGPAICVQSYPDKTFPDETTVSKHTTRSICSLLLQQERMQTIVIEECLEQWIQNLGP